MNAVSAYLAKSQSSLDCTTKCILDSNFSSAANRLYYSLLQASFSFLSKHSKVPLPKGPGSHEQLIQRIENNPVIKRLEIKTESFNKAKALRKKADYTQYPIRKEDIERIIEGSKSLCRDLTNLAEMNLDDLE